MGDTTCEAGKMGSGAKLLREGARLGVMGTSKIGGVKLKRLKNRAQRPCQGDVGEILVVGPDYKWLLCPFRSVPPLHQSQLYS